jgi:exonuclease VII small subunit
MQFDSSNNNLQDAENYLKVAHQKLMQAQQKIDNRELNEQLVLEQALDAVNKAQQAISNMK